MIYRGKEYSSGSLPGGHVVIFSTDEADLENGFQKHKSDQIFKMVSPQDLESAYTVTTKGFYQDVECSILDVQGDEVLLQFYDNYLIAEKLGFTAIEPTIFEKRVEKASIQKVWEERTPMKGFDLQENERKVWIVEGT
ncbi:hypothetical protein OS242_14240 [Tumebacillus sp. DT12]|uniref:Uncharacterized protein n=1 Tax=Tumebacillus lacus TaxID=2995335 RepID=A0ABT3X559_9BACL|nr:hypothetical protein [Tumebacillus lacus]MCX7571107.1 hypothetical protein [Tumebacillus lacus]